MGLASSGFTVDDLGDLETEAFLARAGARVGAVFGEDLVEFFSHDEGEIFEVIFEGVVGLVEPELIEVKNAGFFLVEPNGVALRLAEFATRDLVDNKGAGITVGIGVFETLDEMNTRGAVAVLVGTAELKVDVVGAEKVEKIVALDESVAEFGIADAGATFTDAFLNKLAVEKLGHTESFADFAKEGQKFDVLEPIIVVEDGGSFRGMGDADDLLGEGGFVVCDFVERLEVALGGVFRVANLASGAANKVIRSISVANEAGTHHESGEVADMKRVGGRVGAPIKIMRSFV